jgi:hypothetical protein
MSIESIKRQAEILEKEIEGLKYNRALNIAAKLNDFKDWHHAQTELKKEENITEICILEESNEPYPPAGSYIVKVKMFADIAVYFEVKAKTYEEAIEITRTKIDKNDNDLEAWEREGCNVTWYYADTARITSVEDSEGHGPDNDYDGLELNMPKWFVRGENGRRSV